MTGLALPIREVAIASADGTIARNMASERAESDDPVWMTTEQAIQYIASKIGRRVTPSRFRAMLTEGEPILDAEGRKVGMTGHPAVRQMKTEGRKEQAQWRWPLSAVDRAAELWPRDRLSLRGRPEGRPREIAPLVESAIARWGRRGKSLQWICDELYRQGIKTPTGNREWDKTTVRRVLERNGIRRAADGENEAGGGGDGSDQ